MNPSTPATPTQRRAHAGWLWAALALHAIGAAMFQFNTDFSSSQESRSDWALRLIVLFGLALGLIQLSTLIIRHVAGAEIAASMRRRMIVAALALGFLEPFFSTYEFNDLMLFGLVVGIAWRRWMRLPWVWLPVAIAAGLATYIVNEQIRSTLIDMLNPLGYGSKWAFYGGWRGLLWALVGGTAFAILHTFAPNTDLAKWRNSLSTMAEMLPYPRWLKPGMLVLALVGTLAAVYVQGRQSCRWIDRALERSGCVDSIASRTFFSSVMMFSQDGETLLVTDLDGVALYDFPSRQQIQALDISNPSEFVYDGALAPDGSQFALVMQVKDVSDRKITIYRRGEATPFQMIMVPDTGIREFGFALDGRSLLIEDTIWNIADGAALGRVDPASRALYRTDGSGHSSDGSLSAGESAGRLSLYTPRYDGSIGTLRTTFPTVFTDDLHRSVFSLDTTLLATTYWNDTESAVEVWRTSDGSLVSTILVSTQDRSRIQALAFTPDNQHLLVANDFQDTIEIYRLP